MNPFVHLHCHTHYSLLDGANRVPELIAHVKALGMNAVAMTDHGNLYGAVEFYKEAIAAGVNPIIGYEAYVAAGSRFQRDARRRGEAGYHLTLLAKNTKGFQNLVKMASAAYLEGLHHVPRIDKELLEAHKEGIICLSGCASSEFSEFILREQLDEATQLAAWFAKLFGKDFYVEIQNNGLDIQRLCAEGAIEVANRLGLPLVATCDAHYLTRDHAVAHDVLLCVNTRRTRNDPNRMRYGSDQFYVRAPAEMYQLFPDQAEAVKRSQQIADGCDIKLDLKARHFPAFEPPAKKTPEKYLRELCEAGLQDRYGKKPPEHARARLEHELGIILRMGYAGYFLVVWDFVRFAREKGIPASARGSACGAIVSYVLKLSDVCPLEYDLLFERFLDPNRSEAPDIDIDFCQDRREEVIAYVKNKYGADSVAQIATFGTMAAKAALRDVGRALDIPLERVNSLIKHVPTRLHVTLDDAIAESPDFRNEYEKDPLVHEWVDIARALEGTNRNAGVHAAGVVISQGKLTDYVPLATAIPRGEEGAAAHGERVITTQWVMGDIEAIGLLKMDFLGLRTLTVLENARREIKNTRGEKINLYKLPLEDQATYQLLQRGDAKGVFQFESDGIRELLKRLRPDNIRDIIACTALYRPGPLGGGMVESYINRKHGREKPAYQHPVMEEVLAETYGVQVYQEQVMRILNRLGGIGLSDAYACIKAISKKKREVIDAQRGEFIRGAVERGVAKSVAEEIFDQIEYFGGYGFNKSHSAAYALVSFQTAYLKAHYTPEFMAALLSSEIDDGNKRDVLVDHIADARRLGVDVRPPDVNEGGPDFTVREGHILFGLTAIKGLGRAAAEEIARAREEKGPYHDLFNFCERVDLKAVPKSAIERLIKAGGFDSLCNNRAALLATLPRAIQAAGELQQDRRRGQLNIFDAVSPEEVNGVPQSEGLADVPDWPASERLKFEKEALDFYFSSHPLAEHSKELRRFASHEVSQLKKVAHGQRVLVGGMLTQVRFMNVKKARNGNSRYVRCKIEDFSGLLEAMMWPDEFARYKDDFTEDRILFGEGVIEHRGEEPLLVMSRVFDIDTARREMTKGLVLKLELGQHQPAIMDDVAKVLCKTPGSCPVYVQILDAAGKRAVLRAAPNFQVNPADVKVGELESLLGDGKVMFTGR
ncbi:MAG: DNA polymerase III subunit alpha [Gemmataceae bacterium]